MPETGDVIAWHGATADLGSLHEIFRVLVLSSTVDVDFMPGVPAGYTEQRYYRCLRLSGTGLAGEDKPAFCQYLISNISMKWWVLVAEAA